MDRKLLYSKKDSSRDIKNCTKASLRDSFPCWHNGTIILPTNDSFVFYRVERNEEGLFPIEEPLPATDCPTLDLPSTVTPDPLRPGDNAFRTTPSPQSTHGILIGCLAGVILPLLILILILMFLSVKKEVCYSHVFTPQRARHKRCLNGAGIAEVAHSADSN
ncbi:hypothetical protein AGOR_G00222190 [Albula goreensis]|uniref:Uncharacterized protein n=1 Tax=Albula goreensis TaxID=1534307 RepID=A0A8T3CJ81_9TELE|nr:hypothetical protein AGOR_G00222190 [Albula goreensis]